MVHLSAGFDDKLKLANNRYSGERNTHQLNGTRAMDDVFKDIKQRMKDVTIDEG